MLLTFLKNVPDDKQNVLNFGYNYKKVGPMFDQVCKFTHLKVTS